MRKLINAGFGQPLPQHHLDLIKRLGFDGIRTDIFANHHKLQGKILRGLEKAQLSALFVYHTSVQPMEVLSSVLVALDYGVKFDIELGNEANLGLPGPDGTQKAKLSPTEYANWVIDCYRALHKPGYRNYSIYTGSVHALIPDALEYFRAFWTSLHRLGGDPYRDYVIRPALHPYRAHLPQNDPKGLKLWEDWLRIIGRGVPFGITEIGWNTDTRTDPFPFFWRKWAFTDQEVADFAVREQRMWKLRGASLLAWYQLNDDAARGETWGIRKQDYAAISPPRYYLKPVARVWK